MKKILYFSVAVLALAFFASCSKEDAPKKSSKVTVDIKVADLNNGTKAVKTTWAEGDKINIWFDGVSSPHYSYWREMPHLVLTYTSGSWVSSEVEESLLSATGTFKAVYEASNSLFGSVINSDYVYSPDGTSFKLAAWTYDANPYSISTTCYKNGISYNYNSSTKKISGTITGNWNYMTRLQVVITGLAATPDRYAMSFGGGVQLAEALHCTGGDLSESSIGTCNGASSSFNWSNGVSNADGIAFNFYKTLSDTSYDYTLFLVDKTAKKVYSFSKTAAITTNVNSCHGIKVSLAQFTDVTATYPFDS